MDLRGDALRADVRRICSLAYVMPPAPEDHEEQAKRVAERLRMLENAKRARARAMAERPDGCLTVQEVSRMIKRSTGHIGARLRTLNIKPRTSSTFDWYHRSDLIRARILPDPLNPVMTTKDICTRKGCTPGRVSQLVRQHGIRNHGTERWRLYLVQDLQRAGII